MKHKKLKEEILRLLTEKTVPIRLNEISKNLGIISNSPEYDTLKNILQDLSDEGIIIKLRRRRYSLPNFESSSTYQGIFRVINGKGFVELDAAHSFSYVVGQASMLDYGIVGQAPQPDKRTEKDFIHRQPTISNLKSTISNRRKQQTRASVPPISIRRRNFHTALDGDLVKIKLLAAKKNKKPRGEVIEIIGRNQTTFVGTIEYDGSFHFLIPDEDKFYIDFLIPKSKLEGAANGDKVSVEFIKWDDPLKSPTAKVIEIIGKSGEPVVEFESLIKELNLPEDFSQSIHKEEAEIHRQSKSIPSFSNRNELKKSKIVNLKSKIQTDRLDLRNKLIITIDPPDAKDFDDALSLDILTNGNYWLGVHIADVSHYVKENSAIDIEARQRGTSIYLVDRVIPMLPESLSNDLCSLKPNHDRMALSVFMEFTQRGVLKNYEIYESIINNKRRFNYNEVLNIIEMLGQTPLSDMEQSSKVNYQKSNKKNKKSNTLSQQDLTDFILMLNRFAETLRKKRFAKGGIDFNSSEVKFRLDKNKNPVEAILKESNAATQLVEECMLAANQAVASHIGNKGKGIWQKGKRSDENRLPFVYRVHDVPDEKIFRDALDFIKTFDIKHPIFNKYRISGTGKTKLPSTKEINQMVSQIEDSSEKYIVNQVLIRSMAKAVYSTVNIGHYGLGFDEYTHFTSPIRRYPDLIVHRLLKQYGLAAHGSSYANDNLNTIPNPESLTPATDDKWKLALLKGIAKHSSERERFAIEAERESIKLAACMLANNYIGEKFDGTVSGVASFGIFVLLDNIYAEGLVHIKDLPDDYYSFDNKNFCIIGRRKKTVFRMGKRIRVKIINVNIDRRKINLELVS